MPHGCGRTTTLQQYRPIRKEERLEEARKAQTEAGEGKMSWKEQWNERMEGSGKKIRHDEEELDEPSVKRSTIDWATLEEEEEKGVMLLPRVGIDES